MLQKTIKHLFEPQRFPLYLILAISIWMSIGVSFFRVFLSGNVTYFFLNWNLWLAFMPFAISVLMFANRHSLYEKPVLLSFLGVAWLLFLPNAPYITTDLFHLRHVQDGLPIWFDTLMVLSFAWNGLLLGFLSLVFIQQMVAENFSSRVAWLFSGLVWVLVAFGIYLGRYLRWNSWDILADPLGLFYDISDRFLDPFSHPRTLGMTLFFSMFLMIAYTTLYILMYNFARDEQPAYIQKKLPRNESRQLI